jgi:hypothetical protein
MFEVLDGDKEQNLPYKEAAAPRNFSFAWLVFTFSFGAPPEVRRNQQEQEILILLGSCLRSRLVLLLKLGPDVFP